MLAREHTPVHLLRLLGALHLIAGIFLLLCVFFVGAWTKADGANHPPSATDALSFGLLLGIPALSQIALAVMCLRGSPAPLLVVWVGGVWLLFNLFTVGSSSQGSLTICVPGVLVHVGTYLTARRVQRLATSAETKDAS